MCFNSYSENKSSIFTTSRDSSYPAILCASKKVEFSEVLKVWGDSGNCDGRKPNTNFIDCFWRLRPIKTLCGVEADDSLIQSENKISKKENVPPINKRNEWENICQFGTIAVLNQWRGRYIYLSAVNKHISNWKFAYIFLSLFFLINNLFLVELSKFYQPVFPTYDIRWKILRLHSTNITT